MFPGVDPGGSLPARACHHDGQADQTLGGADGGMRRGFYARYKRITGRLSGLLVLTGKTIARHNLLVSLGHTSKSPVPVDKTRAMKRLSDVRIRR
jgi:hypothetical protein